jgi:hypothetical protein
MIEIIEAEVASDTRRSSPVRSPPNHHSRARAHKRARERTPREDAFSAAAGGDILPKPCW